ncbi:MAG: DTW domain-containing protein [Planctomycetaceae bacterium]|nr:DTW domain-containing protein [Planctomycetaceae bacterium]
MCYCSTIPTVANRTPILMLQHRRERFHPFNTARIVNQALEQSNLLVGHNHDLSTRFDQLPLQAETGLLFPGDDAKVLTEIPESEFPKQLIVPDGTWHHVKTLMRDIPRLQTLPRFCLAPTNPSRYRIRREPHAHGLSTLEAVVSALRSIEPETRNLDQLLATFDRMIDSQIKQGTTNWRKNQRRRSGIPNVPRALTGGLENIVVGYGEQEPGNLSNPKSATPMQQPSYQTQLMYWTAIRPASGERFHCAIDSPAFQNEAFMQRLRLSPEEVRERSSRRDFAKRWSAFLRPTDRLVVLHPSTATLLHQLQPDAQPPLILKAINVSINTGTEIASSKCFPSHHGKTSDSRAEERLNIAIERVASLNLAFRKTQ